MRQCLVTGANRGLGLEFVRQLLGRGARVVACCRDPHDAGDLDALAESHGSRLRILALDIADPESVAALSTELGASLPSLDLLVNNAGVLISGERFGNVRAESLAQSFAVNASGPLLLTQALAPLLERGHDPGVLCLSSQLGSIAQSTEFRTVSYAMSKAALNMAVKRLAAELGPRGIAVVAAHPGWVRTRMGGEQASMRAAESVRLLLERMAATRPADSGGFVAYDGTRLPW